MHMYIDFMLSSNYEKALHSTTIIGSSESGCVLIILFQPNGTKGGLFEGNLLSGSM